MANPSFCIDTLSDERETQVGIYTCKGNLSDPGWRQTFRLRVHRDISLERSNNNCLDLHNFKIINYHCKFNQDNQYFRYDLNTNQIYCGPKRNNLCVEVNMRTKLLTYATCNSEKLTQKWKWGFVNETMLNDWINFGKPIIDQQEMMDLQNEMKNIL